MKLEVLGCYGGVDTEHNPVTLLLDDVYLLDAGTIVKQLDLGRQAKLRSIFITHCHLDHIKDLCFLADNLILMGKGALNVFGLKSVLGMLKKFVMNNQIWPDFFSIKGKKGKNILNLRPLKPGVVTELEKGYTVELIETTHACKSAGYIIGKNGKHIVYTGDTGPTKKLWTRLNKLEGLEAIIIEISFPDRLKELAVTTGHLTPCLFLEEVSKLKKHKDVKFLIFHMKPPLLAEIKKEIGRLPVKNIRVMADGDIIRL